jgi:hypothetical protein
VKNRNNALSITAALICATFLSNASSSALARPVTAKSEPVLPPAGSVEEQDYKVKLNTAKIEEGARKRRDADRKRDERINQLGASICTGCGGPAIPFDPTGGEPPLKGSSKHRQQ